MWVRSEYAGELSVLLTWASALVPWSLSVNAQEAFTFVVVRFPLFAFQFLYGVVIRGAEVPFLPVYAAPGFPQNPGVAEAYTVWQAGALVYLLALSLSVVYYARDRQLEALLRERVHRRADPVRVLGALLALSGLVLVAATLLLTGVPGVSGVPKTLPGVTVPIGSVFMVAFGAVLLRVERAD